MPGSVGVVLVHERASSAGGHACNVDPVFVSGTASFQADVYSAQDVVAELYSPSQAYLEGKRKS